MPREPNERRNIKFYTIIMTEICFILCTVFKMETADQDREIVKYLEMLSDGFDVFKGRRKNCSAWPVFLTALNFRPEHYFKAKPKA